MNKVNESAEGFRRESRGERATHAGDLVEECVWRVCEQEGECAEVERGRVRTERKGLTRVCGTDGRIGTALHR